MVRSSTVSGSTSGRKEGVATTARPLRRRVDPFGNRERAAVSPRLGPRIGISSSEATTGISTASVEATSSFQPGIAVPSVGYG